MTEFMLSTSFSQRLLVVATGVWVLLYQTFSVIHVGSMVTSNESLLRRSDWHRRTQQSLGPSRLNVFYHVFLDPNDLKQGTEVFDEQMNELKDLLGPELAEAVPIRYSTNGSPKATEAIKCPDGLQCVHYGHREENSEYRTLDYLHKFCLANPDDLVIYMHSKGAASHPGEAAYASVNKKVWRQQMLRAVTSKDCRNALQKDQCDACGLSFMTPWAPIFPGNFFIARCDYVKKLVTPDAELAIKFNEIENKSKAMDLGFTMFQPEPWNTGTELYAYEQWIGTHPSIRPCDMAPLPHLLDVTHGVHNGFYTQSFSMAPGFSFDSDWFKRPEELSSFLLPEARNQRLKEFYLLPGLLLKYHHLYQRYPDPNSWVWQWYPDGDIWKNGMNLKPGTKAAAEIFENISEKL